MVYFLALTQLVFQEIWMQLAGKISEACIRGELACMWTKWMGFV